MGWEIVILELESTRVDCIVGLRKMWVCISNMSILYLSSKMLGMVQ